MRTKRNVVVRPSVHTPELLVGTSSLIFQLGKQKPWEAENCLGSQSSEPRIEPNVKIIVLWNSVCVCVCVRVTPVITHTHIHHCHQGPHFTMPAPALTWLLEERNFKRKGLFFEPPTLTQPRGRRSFSAITEKDRCSVYK